jgi:hypothetical protein
VSCEDSCEVSVGAMRALVDRDRESPEMMRVTAWLLCFAVLRNATGCSFDRSHHRGLIDSAYFIFRPTRRPSDSVRFVEPTALVKEYARRDAAGEPLSASFWVPSAPAWANEPGWNAFTVIRGYSVAPAVVTGDSALVAVTYSQLGQVAHSGGPGLHFVLDSATETVVFALRRTGGGWKITAPDLDKHVLIERALELKTLMDSTQRLLGQLGHTAP